MNCVISAIIVLFGIHLLEVLAYSPNTCYRCQNDHSCKPPNCVCCSDDMPLKYKEVPQMVFFTFDDAITPQVAGFYRQLFDSSRRNPNGCPISMTLFISHSNTVYSLVREFYQKGMEIASHSVSHGHPKASTFKDEAKKQKQNLARMARIPHTRINGWRSPFLEPLGDAQPNMLQDLGYSYDATLTISKKALDEKPPVPFTLDYGWPYDCKIKPCPKRRHRGFWEVPVISLMDYLKRFDCVYVDGCNNPPPDEEAAFRFLWDNFQGYYKTNKAPFGINMHASWFFYPDRLKAMDRFIRELVLLDDVYILSIKQVIDWLRNPVSLENIKSFLPWRCDLSNNTTSSSNSAFELRNKQIEQRLKELRRQRYVKQELELMQQHHTWEMQQAAKKAAKYSEQKNGRRSNRIYAQQQRKSSAMTWQQMLMAHARKQHAKSLSSKGNQYNRLRKGTNTRANKNIKRINPLSTRRMVRPVSKHSDPKQKQIMLQEQKRIRKQQRLAAEKRLKEKERVETEKQSLENKNLVKLNKPATKKEVSKSTKDIRQKLALKQTSDIQKKEQKIKPTERPFASKQPLHSKSLRRNNISNKSKRLESKSSGPSHQEVGIANKQEKVEYDANMKQKVLYSAEKSVKGQRQNNNGQILSLQEAIDKPVHRKRTPFNTKKSHSSGLLSKKQTEVGKTTSSTGKIKNSNDLSKRVNKDRIDKSKYSDVNSRVPTITNKPKTFSRPRKTHTSQKIQLIGDSWNLFNTSDVNMKIPWRNWIIQDFQKPKIGSVNQSVGNSQIDIQENKIKSKPKQTARLSNRTVNTRERNKILDRHILFSAVPPSTNTNNSEYKNYPTISPTTNTTSVVKAMKMDVKLTRNEHDTSRSVLSECRQDINCFMPDCFCMTNKNPFNLKRNEIPQIVYITIEGEVNFLTYSKVRSLFNTQRKNPNGCSTGSTIFVSERGTSYSLARNLQRYGTEIALKGLKSDGFKDMSTVKSDMDKRMNAFMRNLGDRRAEIIGWRNSDLKGIDEEHLSIFENRTIYDSSVVLERSMKSWPFTLDFGLNKFCHEELNCQIQNHPGVWEVPIIPFFGFNQSQLCIHVEECLQQRISTEHTYQYLMKNFEKYYHGNRAPFGLHLTQKWFHWSYGKNLAGLSRFIDRVLENGDVYMVSIKDMLKWIKNPVKVSELKNSVVWNC